ncbi:acyltransferase family protein [Evansella cellulosilytica]|uniref:Protein involved in polysaccharide intercellular adhesin (PIA) synthesis/biofilm formation-like protein n=1 Tax=Evansella cellulosilytica (strain ATCC 21833 / DSM 2522 / FERM P-1141 / JCM 9156 / N-4) TaxID=649639 RepID=E6U0V2_EVAC2|nr:acyltransferase family protein [Evansella cellulosilytica]ADU30264.1 protein involved in polysaccharide intercellular adhesin (PIA) synthesis/biofilm formation-like protein [Evansella cellulosilytica DSM 2522]
MKKQMMVNEIFFLRSVACLSIVFIHAIAITLQSNHYSVSSFSYRFYDSMNILLYFGTPMFIFISIFLLSFSYRNKEMPKNFLNKRLKLIYVPFIIMAFFYSIPYMSSFSDWGVKFVANAVIGDFHGYFVLIIFQFYVIYLLVHKQLKKMSPFKVISFAFLVNIAYLSFFNYTEPLSFPFAEYIWERFYWVPFVGWIFYFAVGYYSGLYFEKVVSYVKKYKNIVLFGPLLSSFILLYLYHNEILVIHSSKRIDILLHTTIVAMFLFLIATKIKNNIPSFLLTISKYSFGIYLLHFFYILALQYVLNLISVSLPISISIFALFSASIFLSIATIQFLNQWNFGQYIVGKVGVGLKNNNLDNKSKKYREEHLKYSS